MSELKTKNGPPGQSGGARNNESGLGQVTAMPDTLPMGHEKKRGRKPKGSSPFTKNFIRLLKERDCSHRKAAAIAGVSPSVISGWTAGSVPNDPTALLKITDALGADFKFILTGVPTDSIPSSRLGEIFEIDDEPALSGIFMIDLKRMRVRK